jgi:hypothetical protein
MLLDGEEEEPGIFDNLDRNLVLRETKVSLSSSALSLSL